MVNSRSTDAELWEAIQADDLKAYNCFVDRHWERVFTSVFWVTRDREVCKEIVNDIFLNLWLKRAGLHITFFKTYLTNAARYHVYRYLQRAEKRRVSYLEDSAEAWQIKADHDTDDSIRYNELEQQVDNNLQMLPKRCQEIFSLSRKEHLSNDEIARRLDISKRTVENQLTHALRHLRVALRSIFTLLVLLVNT